MVNETTGAEFGPQEGVIETVPENEPKPMFYVREVVTEKVLDTHQEVREDEDGNPVNEVVAEEHEERTERLFGPFVKAIADEQVDYTKRRFRAQALAGDQVVDLVSADEHSTEPHQDPVPAATEPNVSDALTGEPSVSTETGTVVDPGADKGDLIPDKAAGDAPSWSVTPVEVPTSDQETTDGAVTNPPLTAPAGNPADVPQATIPSAPVEDPNTVDAITGSSTEADDTTVDETAPPVAPQSPSVADGPADGAPIEGTVAETEPIIPDAAPTIPVADTQGDTGADQINEDAPLNIDAPVVTTAPADQAPVEANEPKTTEVTQPVDTDGNSVEVEPQDVAAPVDRPADVVEPTETSDVPVQDEPVTTVDANPQPEPQHLDTSDSRRLGDEGDVQTAPSAG